MRRTSSDVAASTIGHEDTTNAPRRKERMQKIGTGWVAALALMATGPTLADGPDVDQAQALFDAMAEQYPALNATVMVAGEIVWEAEGGVMRDDRDGVERDYNFYSIAKMITGLAYARLEQETRLDLDQDIRSIDPELPRAYDGVTLRQLLSHAGGVRHYRGGRDWRGFNDRRCATPADAIGHFIDDRLASDPGEEMSYSTFGFTLLSHLLVRITGEADFDAAMRSALGDSYLAVTDRIGADKAQNYLGEVGDFEAIELSAECKFGGGGLLASSRDLAAMGTAFYSGDIIALDRVGDVLAPLPSTSGEDISYVYGMGSGWSEEHLTHYAAHSGGSPGGRAFLLVYVESQVSIALTSNFDGPRHNEIAIALGEIFAPE
jgi:serine beta-lactamase-like protein LACTB